MSELFSGLQLQEAPGGIKKKKKEPEAPTLMNVMDGTSASLTELYSIQNPS